jgi:hypothetical protein
MVLGAAEGEPYDMPSSQALELDWSSLDDFVFGRRFDLFKSSKAKIRGFATFVLLSNSVESNLVSISGLAKRHDTDAQDDLLQARSLAQLGRTLATIGIDSDEAANRVVHSLSAAFESCGHTNAKPAELDPIRRALREKPHAIVRAKGTELGLLANLVSSEATRLGICIRLLADRQGSNR